MSGSFFKKPWKGWEDPVFIPSLWVRLDSCTARGELHPGAGRDGGNVTLLFILLVNSPEEQTPPPNQTKGPLFRARTAQAAVKAIYS